MEKEEKLGFTLYKIHGQFFLKALFPINILLIQKEGALLSCKMLDCT